VEGNIISEKQLHFWHVYHTNALYDFRRVEIWCTSSMMDFCGAFLWHFGACHTLLPFIFIIWKKKVAWIFFKNSSFVIYGRKVKWVWNNIRVS